MIESKFPIEKFANKLKYNMQYASKLGQDIDAELIYYFLVNKYDPFHALEVLHLATDFFHRSTMELNEIISKLNDELR